MRIQDISLSLTKHAKCKALAKQVSSLTNDNPLYVEGLHGSAGATVFSGVSELLNDTKHTFLYILNDEDEAGYFYNDLSTILGSEKVLFFPSPYRRKIKYAQRDYANDILRTEVLSSLSVNSHNLHIITFPEAISVKVVSPKAVVTNTIHIKRGDEIDMSKLTDELLALGFVSTDYVYEPGNFAIRGSIIDIFSYSSEYPFRIDFFGDEVDSIRTFNVQTQLSL